MKNYKRMEVGDLFYGKLTLNKNQLFYCGPTFKKLYNDYLEQGIKLTYHGRNLLKLVERENKKIYKKHNEDFDEDVIKKIKRRINLEFAGKCILTGLWTLTIYSIHAGIKNYTIHEETNGKNSYAAFKYLSYDFDGDGVKELNTSILNYIDYYFEPTEDAYYKNSNIFYDMCDTLRISDNITCMAALDMLDLSVIEIDGVKYSESGYVTELYYLDLYDKEFKKMAYGYLYGSEESNKKLNSGRFLNKEEVKIINAYSYPCKTLEEIPTIYKSKETGKIKVKEPNKIFTKAVEHVMKTYY